MSKRNYITSFRAKEGTPSALLVEEGEITLEKAFDLVSNELRDYNEKFTKLEGNLDNMDHKFTTLIDDLKEDVGEAINLAWFARSLVSQNV